MIKRYRNKEYPKGDFVDLQGNVLGTHEGIINYTIGQRRGLGIPADRRLYVKRLDTENNRVILADDEDLFDKEVMVREFNWITGDAPSEPIRCQAKIRYRHKEQPATATIFADGKARIVFDEPQRAITPGQSAVLYDGEIVLGGGIIG
jgi:tRNA-specific 2-thiouridylase